MIDWFTLNETVEKTGIPYQTLSRYVNRHSQYLRLKKEHKSYLVHGESVSVLEEIRQFYQDGLNEKQVNKEISLRGTIITLETKDENELITLDNTLRSMNEKLEFLQEKANNQEDFNKELVRQLEKQQLYMNTRLEERDRTLILALKESIETQKQIASTSKKWWQIWNKI